MSAHELITDHLDLWTQAVTKKSTAGRGSNGKVELTGIKKLRELILELAVRGKLVEQDPNDEPADELLQRIKEEKTRLTKEGKIKKPKKLPDALDDEKLFSLPYGWQWASIARTGIASTGKTPSTKIRSFFDGDIPFIGPGQITPAGRINTPDKFISEEGILESDEALPGDILVVCIGGSIGKCAKVQERCGFNQQINKIRPMLVHPDYLLSALSTDFIQKTILERSTGSATPIINRSKWESICIPLPPINEQHRIVQKVDELMALCDRLEQHTSDQLNAHETLVDTLLGTLAQSANATELADNWARLAEHFDTLFTTEQSIDKLKQAILQLAVMGRLVEQDAGDEPAVEVIKRAHERKIQLLSEKLIKKQKELPDITEPEKPFSIPPLWAYARLDDICTEVTSGSTPPKSEFSETFGIPYLKVYNIRSQRVNFDYKPQYVTENYHRTTLKRSQLLPGDVVMNIVGPPLGKTAIVPDDHPEWNCNQAIVRFRPIEIELNQFIHLYLKAGIFLKTIELIGTAGQDNISVTKSRSIVIPLPPKAEQHRIVQKVDELMALCDQLKERLNQASDTRCQLSGAVVDGALN